MRTDLTVVIPVYRNRGTVRVLRDRLTSTLERGGRSFELLFVDDGCPEGSLTVLEALAAEDPRISVLALSRNVGQHRAVMAGLARASGDRVVVVDADLQDPPEAIPVLLERLDRGSAAVFAARRGRYESSARLATSRVFKWVLHRALGVPRGAGIFVALDRRMVDRLLAFRARRPFVVAMIGHTRLPLDAVPVARSRRPEGSSAYGTWRRLASAARGLGWLIGRPSAGGAADIDPEVLRYTRARILADAPGRAR